MNPALRQGDLVKCTTECEDKPKCPDGKVIEGSPNTFINNKLAARKDDTTSNCCGSCCPCPNKILTGSETVFINNKQAAHSKSVIKIGQAASYSYDVFV